MTNAEMRLKQSPRIIGLVGYAGVGKDTAAHILVNDFGYVRIGFADPLKQILKVMGWDGDKSNKSPCVCCGMLQGRELLQVAGTEGVRQVLGENIWTDYLISVVSDLNRKFVVSDVRFVDEANRLKEHGALLIRIGRVGQSPALGHTSETEVDRIDSDLFISNDGSLEELRQNLQNALDILQTSP